MTAAINPPRRDPLTGQPLTTFDDRGLGVPDPSGSGQADGDAALVSTPAPGASAATVDPKWRELMGDDGTGHCRGCGKPLDHIDPDCEVCYRALCAFMDEEVDSDGKPF